MSIQRKSELVKLVISVADDRSVVTTATYASGAWDGDKQEWVGKPHEIEEPFNSFAHDAGRIKGVVGQMLLRVAQGHEALKEGYNDAVHTMRIATTALSDERAAHAQTVELAERTKKVNGDLFVQNKKLWEHINATPVARKNPLLHRLTGGRAGR